VKEGESVAVMGRGSLPLERVSRSTSAGHPHVAAGVCFGCASHGQQASVGYILTSMSTLSS
jgi:hypothetical protein